MKNVCFVSLLSPLLVLIPGCQNPPAPQSEKMVAPSTKPDSIVIDIGEQLAVQHEAQPGQTLEWKSNSSKTPNFWIQFDGTSPCANGALVLAGSTTKVASCVAGSSSGASGTILYSYSIHASVPPPLPPQVPTSDRIGRCVGCNN